MNIYAAYVTPDGEHKQRIFPSYDEYYAETFSPDSKVYYATDLRPKSKEEARDIVKKLSEADMYTVDNNGEELSYGELETIYEATEGIAKRFGLIREFRDNGIL